MSDLPQHFPLFFETKQADTALSHMMLLPWQQEETCEIYVWNQQQTIPLLKHATDFITQTYNLTAKDVRCINLRNETDSMMLVRGDPNETTAKLFIISTGAERSVIIEKGDQTIFETILGHGDLLVVDSKIMQHAVLSYPAYPLAVDAHIAITIMC